ncbi:hypothetical protein PspLS_01030 [Pyricularia sp. CBS 133598]|nr:hypothetical protein PspLS_01030 [Pyricularia sp. CBS 133598]
MSTQAQRIPKLVAKQSKTTSPNHNWAPKKKRAFKNVDNIPTVDAPVMSSPTAKQDRNAARQSDVGEETLTEDFEGSTMVEEGEVKTGDGSCEDAQKKSSRVSA